MLKKAVVSLTYHLLPYDRAAAAAYARTWALSRNPAFYDFERLGGDCTNFASQAIYAGCRTMNYRKTFGWYYISLNDRAPAWTGVEYLYNFLLTNRAEGPRAEEADLPDVQIGDVIQLATIQPDFHHSPVVIDIVGEPLPQNIYLAAHSANALDAPLSAYAYHKLRLLHITAVGSSLPL